MNLLKINILKNPMQNKLINPHILTSSHHLILTSSHQLIIIVLCFLLFSCGNKNSNEFSVSDIKNPATADGIDKQKQANMPEIQFDNLSYNFGKVIQGEILSYIFHFKNTGKSNLIISGISASCGCTTSIPPKAPIKPGEKGEITITFDSKFKDNEVTSYLLVVANTYPAQTVLTVQATVIIP
ncbi:MAG: DUF1573 domain-containing protein [Bacteroidetes bacterium]|nr:DUF1573 domain-containing protein [Bacteroidota bacterium]MCL1969058.1 DUF1573 domain-containing protein [Bacteroidota bacterium]